jgi:pSer/pThr/pTyr-binding forkhead associated (FHA) protein
MPTTREKIIDPTIRERLIDAIKPRVDGKSPSEVRDQLDKSIDALDEDVRVSFTEEETNRIYLELIAREPKLRVDWGELPRIGDQANPVFNIICTGFDKRPRIRADIDLKLDHDPRDIFPQSKGEGLWEFSLPFSLTTDGKDCRPGRYMIRLKLAFPESPSKSLARFYNFDMKLAIKRVTDGEEPVLEIDGEGQSLINLQGLDLTQYSKVKIKAGDGALVNVNNPGATSKAKAPPPPGDTVALECELKVDIDLNEHALNTSRHFSKRRRLDKAMFVTEDDRRIILLAKRIATFGRNVRNDVMVRYLPRSESNDGLSRDISRNHMVLEINEEGLLIHDKSSKGIVVNHHVVEKIHTLTADDVDDELGLCFGKDPHSDPFEFDMQLFGGEQDPHDQRNMVKLDDLFTEDLRERFDRAGRLAGTCQINAVRLRRTSNLKEEEYVLVYRHAFIGSSPNESAVVLHDYTLKARHARIIYLGNTFWLQNQAKDGAVQVDDQPIALREMVPLVPGMKIQVGETILQFESAEQIGIDT